MNIMLLIIDNYNVNYPDIYHQSAILCRLALADGHSNILNKFSSNLKTRTFRIISLVL